MCHSPAHIPTLTHIAILLWAAAGWAADASVAGPDADDVGVAPSIAAANADLARGDQSAARSTVRGLSERVPPASVEASQAWQIGLLHIQVGLGDQARPWFERINTIAATRRQAAGPLATGAHAPDLAQPLAAALLALGQRKEAFETLRACNEQRPPGSEGCSPWLMAELAAARSDWPEVVKVMDPWLERGIDAPAKALQWRLRAAMESGDDAAMGRLRLAVIRAGGRLPDAPAQKMEAPPSNTSSLTAGTIAWVIALCLLLLAAGWLAWRRNR